LDPQLRQRIRHEILAAYLADTAESRFLLPTGVYVHAGKQVHARKRPAPFHAQKFFMQLAEGKATVEDIPPEVPARPSAIRPRSSETSNGSNDGRKRQKINREIQPASK
jgi:polyphosphate kinase